MRIHSNPKLQKSIGYDVSPWLVKAPAEFTARDELATFPTSLGTLKVVKGDTSIWGLLHWGKGGGGLALRFAYTVDGMEVQRTDGPGHLRIITAIGQIDLHVEIPEADVALLRWRVTLTPAADLLFPFWPRDVIPITRDGRPLGTRGTVHTMQRGPKAAVVYAVLESPESGAFLYMQDLTSLNDYCEKTGTNPQCVVGGKWPELGFSLPVSEEKSLPAGKPVVISDALLAWTEEIPKDHSKAAEVFLELIARIYPHLQRPETKYHDWLYRADRTLHDLEHVPGCTTVRRGLRYLNAYHESDMFPPESMVQLSVLVPILDYVKRRKIEVPFAQQIKDNLGSFFNSRLGTMVRYLPGEDFSAGREPQQKHNVMDSWYLYHTLLNAGRLAQLGDEDARRLMLLSMPYAIKVARRFKYHWPIFYDLDTIEPIKSTTTGGYGETDVAGLYAHMLLHAHELTGDKQYLDEAIRAAETLEEYGFAMAYQLNSTVYAALALEGLWKRTGRRKFRDLTYVCLANVVVNCWLWQCTYGFGNAYPTFFGLPPLQDGDYIAVYEESESVAAIASFISGMGDDCPPSLRLLLPEYARHLLHRSWYAFPTELPRKIISPKAKDGTINPRISIPLEDLGDGRYAPGQVGQQVYGAGAPLIFAAFCYHEAGAGDFVAFCDYIVTASKAQGTRQRGTLRLDVAGSPRFEARLRLIPLKGKLPRDIQVRQGRDQLPLTKQGKHLETSVRGGSTVLIRWGSAAR